MHTKYLYLLYFLFIDNSQQDKPENKANKLF